MTRLVVVGCVAGKGKSPAPLRDLYHGQLWEARRGYAEASGLPWYVLSAGRGLRPPTFVSAPYEARAEDVCNPAWPVVQLYRLAKYVGRHPHLTGEDELDLSGVVLELHAGRAYHDLIRPRFEAAGVTFVLPLRGLGIGRQLGWYKERRMGQLELTA